VEQVTQAIRYLKTPLTLIVLLLFVFGAGYWGLKAAQAPVPRSVTPCVMTDVGDKLTPNFVQVRVLNAGAASGTARATGQYLRAYGFDVIRVNNDDRQVTETVIVGNAADSPEVLLVQQFFPGSITQGDGRVDHVVDILLGAKADRAPAPNTTLPVSGKVCLPPRNTASASPSPAK
jgi:hypothetical protein